MNGSSRGHDCLKRCVQTKGKGKIALRREKRRMAEERDTTRAILKTHELMERRPAPVMSKGTVTSHVNPQVVGHSRREKEGGGDRKKKKRQREILLLECQCCDVITCVITGAPFKWPPLIWQISITRGLARCRSRPKIRQEMAAWFPSSLVVIYIEDGGGNATIRDVITTPFTVHMDV